MKTRNITQELKNWLGVDDLPEFKPCAYYDAHMDCFRIEFRDCSIEEVDLCKWVTILKDNYARPDQIGFVGISFNGPGWFLGKIKQFLR